MSSLVVLATAASATAEPPPENPAEEDAEQQTFTIDAIIVEGLDRTKREVVLRELVFQEGQQATLADVEESIQRLRNLGLFRIAEYELLDRTIPLPNGQPEIDDGRTHRILHITVDERWTLLPFGNFTRGGGTFSLSVGVFDINVFGRYLEAGGQYQRFGDTNSFVLWGSDPRFLDLRLWAGTSLVWTNRINVLYDEEGEIEGGHLRFRRQVNLGLNREWVRWFRTGISVSYLVDEYSHDMVPESIADLERARGLPPIESALVFRASASIGRINSDSYLRHGISYGMSLAHSNEHLASNVPFTNTVGELRFFEILPLRSNVALRAGAGVSNVGTEHHEFFVGGFNLLRGFLHRRFRGKNFWYSNVEYRIPSLDSRWLVLQHIFFFDTGGVSDELSDFATLSGASWGLGLRVISPKIYSFVARIDYAFPIIGTGRSPLSFGAGQFF